MQLVCERTLLGEALKDVLVGRKVFFANEQDDPYGVSDEDYGMDIEPGGDQAGEDSDEDYGMVGDQAGKVARTVIRPMTKTMGVENRAARGMPVSPQKGVKRATKIKIEIFILLTLARLCIVHGSTTTKICEVTTKNLRFVSQLSSPA